MPSVLRLIGLVNGAFHPFEGKYVVNYDPSPPNMEPDECILEVTHDISKAKRYADHAEAFKEYHRIDTRNPVRPDGFANRPLTAFTATIETVP